VVDSRGAGAAAQAAAGGERGHRSGSGFSSHDNTNSDLPRRSAWWLHACCSTLGLSSDLKLEGLLRWSS